ncbi:MAG: AAC(3) family N-acetyltransferase, partial [Actinomycetota bacterium]|nr:AAC(3) family N-acetyltransferase [Actinomycetota bacterium]
MREEDVVAATGSPVTLTRIVDDLRALGVSQGMTLLAHVSLSRIGWVAGGSHAVVLALEAAVGDAGTLVMPAHSTGLSEPSHWKDPPVPPEWWDVIRAETTPFDPGLTPTRGMGSVAELFRTQSGTLRSAHPHVSFAARGPRAGALLRDHALDSGLGEGSPLARLYDLNAWVLLLGVGHDRSTSLHLCEYRAAYPTKKSVRQGAPLTIDGARRWV